MKKRTNNKDPGKFNGVLVWAWGVALAVALCGCADGAGAADSRALDLAADAAVTPDRAPRDKGPPGASLTGMVVDPLTGAALAGASVAACGVECWPATTDSKGRFAFDDLPAGPYALDVRGDSGLSPTLGVLVIPLSLAPGQVLKLAAPLGLPDPGTGTALTGGVQAVDLDASLRITLDAAALKLPPAVKHKVLAGVAVPQAYWPAYALTHQGQAYTARAMWALNPFDATLSKPAAVRVANSWSLSGSQPAALFDVDPKTGKAARVAPLSTSADGKQLQTAAGQGPARVTWLIVATPN